MAASREIVFLSKIPFIKDRFAFLFTSCPSFEKNFVRLKIDSYSFDDSGESPLLVKEIEYEYGVHVKLSFAAIKIS